MERHYRENDTFHMFRLLYAGLQQCFIISGSDEFFFFWSSILSLRVLISSIMNYVAK